MELIVELITGESFWIVKILAQKNPAEKSKNIKGNKTLCSFFLKKIVTNIKKRKKL